MNSYGFMVLTAFEEKVFTAIELIEIIRTSHKILHNAELIAV